jgi:hypothetical protein
MCILIVFLCTVFISWSCSAQAFPKVGDGREWTLDKAGDSPAVSVVIIQINGTQFNIVPT